LRPSTSHLRSAVALLERLNLEGHLAWANDMRLLCAKADATLAEPVGCSPEQNKKWLEEKLGWLREYQEDVRQWSYFQ
jgi:hypothetical protein